jgi:hypothetical protein
MPSANDAAAELRAALREPGCDPKKIDALLGCLAEPDRISTVRSLSGGDQRRLWRAVDGYRPLALSDLVPASVPALSEVRHYGRNSLPAFKLFEKRFYRPEGADPTAPLELCGANFQQVSPLTGPGYFVVVPHSNCQELCVDYRRLPERAPRGWPAIRSNERGLSRLVYGFMVDTLRRVSEHVTIGSAARHGRDLGSFFVLCRQEHPAVR